LYLYFDPSCFNRPARKRRGFLSRIKAFILRAVRKPQPASPMTDPHAELVALVAEQTKVANEIDQLQREYVRLDGLITKARDEMPRKLLPCWRCEHPQAVECRHWLGQSVESEPNQWSLSGLPICCCRIKPVVGAMLLGPTNYHRA
jgi:hypothetical protein